MCCGYPVRIDSERNEYRTTNYNVCIKCGKICNTFVRRQK